VRVVSLVPSLTETLLSWGITPVACTRFCEQPSLPHVGGTKDPDIRGIVALHPDVVFMDREENRREDAEALEQSGIEVFVTHVLAVDDVAEVMTAVRRRLGLEANSKPAKSGIQFIPHVGKTAFIAIWRRPWMTCNARTYGSSLLASIGVSNVFAGELQTYPTVTLPDVSARRPDLILLPSEPYPFRQRHVAEILDAMPAADPRLIDGQDLFWWGSRTNAARERLAQALG
jgi:ABC-type Fe3+-hydroxamate transport system substrate-binding protein